MKTPVKRKGCSDSPISGYVGCCGTSGKLVVSTPEGKFSVRRVPVEYQSDVRFICTVHARQRMAQRGVTEAEVQETVQHHHTTYTDPDGNRNYVNHVNGRRVRVVIVGAGVGEELRIKTVITD